MSNKKNKFKYWTGQLHLWLGLLSGLFVCFLGITGCILAFEHEIENITQPYRFAKVEQRAKIAPSELKKIADKALPGKHAHSVGYQEGKASQVVYFAENPSYYWIVFLNPYTGEVLKVKNMDDDFFRIVIMGHYYLWLPPNIGQPILATATLMFLFLLISGLVLWWPKNKAASKKRFSIKWNAKWKRVNYDLHNVLGFYMTWVLIFIAITGLVMGFQWFAKSVYWISSGGEPMKQFVESYSDTSLLNAAKGKKPAMDVLWAKTLNGLPGYTGGIEVHVPENAKSAIEVAINPDTETYWKADYLYYDQYSLKEMEVSHSYGKLKNASVADKITRMNYDIHIGAIAGLPGKIIAFLASLIAASLPITGFIIWYGRKKKKAVTSK
ncbi:PepSY-associated TM helix domain-containing protein [Pedobacter gandavensis]|uniref:PepSY-associated TM helix domain-containing protein n=1 Tax=Pedobacter gandavensis TaxID=2679963 RepID=UPI00292F3C23|nr:PepSY-associated TM helix domain-containing protein [Pedobacter gandavensis]